MERRLQGHQVVTERDGLGGLQVGEARHDARGMFFSADHQCALQCGQPAVHLINGVAHPEAEIGCHLIIATARGVEAACHRPDQFGQPRLGRHVDVFKVPVFGHAVCRIFGGNLIKPRGNCGSILRRNNAAGTQHRDMSLGSGDVLLPQRLVEGN